MTKVSIIEIDLGFNISDLINEDVVGLVGEAQKELETAIAVAKKAAALKDQKKQEVKAADDKVNNVMMEAYKALEEAGEQGVSIDNIGVIVLTAIPNISAFTLRMKKILRDKGNPYAIVRKRIGGEPCYVFIPFNKSDQEESEES